jgi:magnesium-transporting ATPase (P-type)
MYALMNFLLYACLQLTEYESDVEDKRDGTGRNVDYRVLVPGDVVKVKSDWKLPCDLLILQGTIDACYLSLLSGIFINW